MRSCGRRNSWWSLWYMRSLNFSLRFSSFWWGFFYRWIIDVLNLRLIFLIHNHWPAYCDINQFLVIFLLNCVKIGLILLYTFIIRTIMIQLFIFIHIYIERKLRLYFKILWSLGWKVGITINLNRSRTMSKFWWIKFSYSGWFLFLEYTDLREQVFVIII